jgi:hypothetical protein
VAQSASLPMRQARHRIQLDLLLGWSPRRIEPATPSLPSMRGWFATPHSTSRPRITAQVGGAIGGGVVGEARSRVAQFLANFWHGELIGQLLRSEPLARSRWMSRCAEDGISPGILDATEGPMTAAHYLAPLLRPLQNSAVTVCAGGR